MSPERLIAWVVVALGVIGCGSDRSLVAAGEMNELPRLSKEPAAAQTTSESSGGAAVPRMQKADPQVRPVSSLELSNEQFATPATGIVAARILANVNGVPILYEEVMQECYPLLRMTDQMPEPERTLKRKQLLNDILERIVDRELVLQDALPKIERSKQALSKFKEAAAKEFDRQMRGIREANHIKSDEQLKAMLQSAGLSLESMRRKAERDFMALEYMRSRVFRYIERLSHVELKQYYEDHLSDFQQVDTVKWQDIFVDCGRYASREAAKAQAEDIARRAKGGEDFMELSRKYDNGDGSYRGGFGFGSRRGEIKPPQVEPFVFAMRPGDIAPVIEMTSGFHIVKLVEREDAGIRPLDEKLQNEIRRKLSAEIGDREYKRIVRELKEKAQIEYAKN